MNAITDRPDPPVFHRILVLDGKAVRYSYVREPSTLGAYLTSTPDGLCALAGALGWLVSPRPGSRIYVSRAAFLRLAARSERAG